MVARRSLTAYQLRWGDVNDFDEAVRDEVLDVCEVRDRSFGDYEMRLYLHETRRASPPWQDLIAEFDEGLELSTESNRALILVRFGYYRAWRYVAFVFGHGRHMLEPGAIDRRFGLRAALNAMYEDGGGVLDRTRVRHVDAKTVAQTTMRTSWQASSNVEFEQFGVDIDRDLLRAVAGEPVDRDKWGSRVGGGESFTVRVRGGLADLGPLAKELVRLGRKKAYRQGFDWIDHIVAVNDSAVLARLRKRVVEAVLTGVESVDLAPPEKVDWDNLAGFRYSIAPEVAHDELHVGDYVGHLGDRVKDLNYKGMEGHRIEVLGSDGDVSYEWPVTHALVAQVELGGHTYLLEEGEFYHVETAFLTALNAFVDGVAESDVRLPLSKSDADDGEQSEGAYNEVAATASKLHLLLDKKLVSIPGVTGQIEICDVLTSNRQFVHVKRHLGSSSLSHLFAQGLVSADLYLTSQDFRDAVRNRIEGAEQARAVAEGDPAFVGRFVGALNFNAPEPRRIEVVYAVIARWNKRTPSEALPFFSKVNLRRTVGELRRVGYNTSFHRVEVI